MVIEDRRQDNRAMVIEDRHQDKLRTDVRTTG